MSPPPLCHNVFAPNQNLAWVSTVLLILNYVRDCTIIQLVIPGLYFIYLFIFTHFAFHVQFCVFLFHFGEEQVTGCQATTVAAA